MTGNPNLNRYPRHQVSEVDRARAREVTRNIRHQIRALGVEDQDIPGALGLPTKTILQHLATGRLTILDMLYIRDIFPTVSIDAAMEPMLEDRTPAGRIAVAEAATKARYARALKEIDVDTRVQQTDDGKEIAELAAKFGISL